jgi:hypothetical protein
MALIYSGGCAEYRLPPVIIFEPFRLRDGVDLFRGLRKKLSGYKDLWRVRVGDYRVVYINDDAYRMGERHPRCPPEGSL